MPDGTTASEDITQHGAELLEVLENPDETDRAQTERNKIPITALRPQSDLLVAISPC